MAMGRLLIMLLALLPSAGYVTALPLDGRSIAGDGVEVHFDLDSVGPKGSRSVALRLHGEVNGHSIAMTLDTGSSINVVAPSVADALGLRADSDSVAVEGVALTTGRKAVADTLRLGNVTLVGVPFYIIDMATGNPDVDLHLRHLRMILGRPLLEMLGTTALDFERRLLSAPRRQKKQKRTRRSNLAVVDNELMIDVLIDGDSLQLIPDLGATHSALGADYVQRHPEVTKNADSIEVYFAGAGGVTRQTGYVRHDVELTIDRKRLSLPQLSVYPDGGYDSRLGMDFFSSQRRVVFDLRRWRLSVVPRKER